MRNKWIIIAIIITSFIMGLYIGGNHYKKQDEITLFNDEFYVDYTNNNKTEKIRYKYVLNYEVEDAEILNKLDFEQPLISLYHNDSLVNSIFPSFTKKPLIPEVSNTKIIKSNQSIHDNFEIIYNNEISKEIREQVRFEAYVYIEKLYKGKWEPIYQIVFMKRGPYWSLNKGPI